MSRHPRAIVVMGVALVVLAAPGTVAAAKKTYEACPGGRFLIEGRRAVGADKEAGGDALVILNRLASIDSGCDPVEAVVKARKRFTLVQARWEGCAGERGRVRLRAKIDAATCDRVKGALSGRKVRKRFSATLAKPPALTTGTFVAAPVAGATVGPAGGTIVVDDPGGPLEGLAIAVPRDATPDDVTFAVSWADITDLAGLPARAAPASKLIRIQVSGSERFNQYGMLDIPALVSLPYEPPPEAADEETVRFYVRNADGSLEAAGFIAQDFERHTITFPMRAFSDSVPVPDPHATPPAAAEPAQSVLQLPHPIELFAAAYFMPTPNPRNTVNTGFLPAANGWQLPNPGSYYDLARGGMCLGMVGAAKHYFARRYPQRLFDVYLDNWPNTGQAPTPTWVDDRVAIEYTSRVQWGLNGAWATLNELLDNPISARGTVKTIVGTLLLTGRPALLHIRESFVDQAGRMITEFGTANHAVMVYHADVPRNWEGQVSLFTYDPNFPAQQRTIVWNSATGFAPYAGSGVVYNNFYQVGFHAGMTDTQLDAMKAAADQSFRGSSVFPTVTIDSITAKKDDAPARADITAGGEHKYVTDDSTIRIQGSITGGLARSFCCAVDTASILVGRQNYFTTVNNGYLFGDGKFDVTVPVPQGESELVVIGGRYRPSFFSPSVDYWSAFWRDIIESTATPAALTIELNWDKDKSDVDLYVKEPDAPDGSKTGDTVYWSHRQGASSLHPYLEIDNTRGRGPEQYYAKDEATTLYTDGTAAPDLYGPYTVKVHYWADHDDDAERVQPIGWRLAWRYLAWCPDPCRNPDKDGTWKTGSASGALTVANSANGRDITNVGPDWSAPILIDYQPTPPPPGGPPAQANLP